MKKGLILSLTGMAGTGILQGCTTKEEKKEGEGQEVSPPEDLMQEHGLLNRILLIYDHCRELLSGKKNFPERPCKMPQRSSGPFWKITMKNRRKTIYSPDFKKPTS